MKIVRYFIHAEKGDTGSVGYMPLWVPRSSNFDPAYGTFGILHDCLEHRLCDTGKVHEEAMAFGRLLALRVVSGVDDMRINGQSLGVEFSGVLRDALNENDNLDKILPATPRMGKLFDLEAGEDIRAMVKNCRSGLRRGISYEESLEMPNAPFFTRLAHWFMIGYIDAHRRYGGRHGCAQIGSLFNRYPRGIKEDPVRRILDKMDDPDDADGHCIRVAIDTEDSSIKVTRVEADENGNHVKSLRQRIWTWKNA